MPAIDLSILNQRQTPAFYADTLANRPAAGFVGRIFVSTNTFAFYRDNGTGWDLIGGPGTGTITGSGATGQIALWDGASTITGDSGLTYNGTDNSLTASKFIVTGGTSSQFLKGDGSLDSSAYVTTNIYNSNGTLSSERTISLNNFNLIFDGGATTARVRLDADTNVARIFSFATNNLPRFAIRVDGTESGGNTGSDYAIRRYDDAGTFVDAPLTITRSTGQSTFAKKVVIENNAGDQQLQIVSTTAPSLRLDNLQTGATKRAGLGISTATNNFIQGSTDSDFCIFNGSTTASPILFGVYDAAAVNVQEAARITAARNFLIGSVTDSGEKLQVNGTSLFYGSIRINVNAANNYDLNIYNTIPRIQLQNPTSGTTTADGLHIYQSGLNSFILNKESAELYIGTANGINLTFASTGAATFSSTLQTNGNAYILPTIAGGGSGGMYLGVFPDTQYSKQAILMERYIGVLGSYGVGTLHFCNRATADTNLPTLADSRMVITSIGNVGIGTSTPQRQFVIANSSGDGLEISNSSGYSTLLAYNRNTSTYQNIVLGEGTGKVLIGTTTDAGQKLQVNGSISGSLINSQRGTSSTLGGGASENILVLGNLTWQLVQANGDSNTTQYATAFAYVNSVGGVTIIPLGNSGISLSSSGSNLLTVTNGGTSQTISYTTIILK